MMEDWYDWESLRVGVDSDVSARLVREERLRAGVAKNSMVIWRELTEAKALVRVLVEMLEAAGVQKIVIEAAVAKSKETRS